MMSVASLAARCVSSSEGSATMFPCTSAGNLVPIAFACIKLLMIETRIYLPTFMPRGTTAHVEAQCHVRLLSIRTGHSDLTLYASQSVSHFCLMISEAASKTRVSMRIVPAGSVSRFVGKQSFAKAPVEFDMPTGHWAGRNHPSSIPRLLIELLLTLAKIVRNMRMSYLGV